MDIPLSKLTHTQPYVFLYSLLMGVLIAFVYDLFKIKRRIIRTGVVFVYIEDILFWIMVTALIFSHIFYFNDGEIRLYIFIGIATGVAAYVSLFSKVLVKLAVSIIEIIWKIVKRILIILFYPVKTFLKIVIIPIRFIFKITGNTYMSVKYKFKKRKIKKHKKDFTILCRIHKMYTDSRGL